MHLQKLRRRRRGGAGPGATQQPARATAATGQGCGGWQRFAARSAEQHKRSRQAATQHSTREASRSSHAHSTGGGPSGRLATWTVLRTGLLATRPGSTESTPGMTTDSGHDHAAGANKMTPTHPRAVVSVPCGTPPRRVAALSDMQGSAAAQPSHRPPPLARRPRPARPCLPLPRRTAGYTAARCTEVTGSK